MRRTSPPNVMLCGRLSHMYGIRNRAGLVAREDCCPSFSPAKPLEKDRLGGPQFCGS